MTSSTTTSSPATSRCCRRWCGSGLVEPRRDRLGRPGHARLVRPPDRRRAPRPRTLRDPGPVHAREVAALAGLPFLGAETVILLGLDDGVIAARSALRRVGDVLRTLEEDDDEDLVKEGREECGPSSPTLRDRSPGTASPSPRHGSGTPTVVLLPTWSLVRSPLEVPGPLPGPAFHRADLRWAAAARSDQPASPAAYRAAEFAADALAVMDATETERAVLVSVSCGALWSLRLCAEHPIVSSGRSSSRLPFRSRPAARAPGPALRRRDRPSGGVGEVQRPSLEVRLPRLRRVLHGTGLRRGAFHEAVRGRGGLGAGDRPGDVGCVRPASRTAPRLRSAGWPSGPGARCS